MLTNPASFLLSDVKVFKNSKRSNSDAVLGSAVISIVTVIVLQVLESYFERSFPSYKPLGQANFEEMRAQASKVAKKKSYWNLIVTARILKFMKNDAWARNTCSLFEKKKVFSFDKWEGRNGDNGPIVDLSTF